MIKEPSGINNVPGGFLCYGNEESATCLYLTTANQRIKILLIKIPDKNMKITIDAHRICC